MAMEMKAQENQIEGQKRHINVLQAAMQPRTSCFEPMDIDGGYYGV
jgi:hypothetical protein